MLYLVLEEGQTLPVSMQKTLRRLYETLGAMRIHAGRLP